MLKNAINNWKTTSAGVMLMSQSGYHLYWLIDHHRLTQDAFLFCVGQILAGVGLIVAGDQSQTKKEAQEVAAQVQGHTEILTKAGLIDKSNEQKTL